MDITILDYNIIERPAILVGSIVGIILLVIFGIIAMTAEFHGEWLVKGICAALIVYAICLASNIFIPAYITTTISAEGVDQDKLSIYCDIKDNEDGTFHMSFGIDQLQYMHDCYTQIKGSTPREITIHIDVAE